MSYNLNIYGGLRVVAIILARNEEKTIHEAVEGALKFVHEVVVRMVIRLIELLQSLKVLGLQCTAIFGGERLRNTPKFRIG